MSEQVEAGQEQPKGDKRRNLRTPLIILKVKIDDGRKAFFGYAKNISRSGLFIATVNPQEPGSRFRVEVPLPAPIRKQVECECEVVWKRLYTRGGPLEPGMGLKFLDMSPEIQKTIQEWVDATKD